jgi:hypothetical protein
MNSMSLINRHPVWSKILGKLSNRVTGDFPEELRQQLFTQEELAKANAMSMDAMADEALQAKNLH